MSSPLSAAATACALGTAASPGAAASTGDGGGAGGTTGDGVAAAVVPNNAAGRNTNSAPAPARTRTATPAASASHSRRRLRWSAMPGGVHGGTAGRWTAATCDTYVVGAPT